MQAAIVENIGVQKPKGIQFLEMCTGAEALQIGQDIFAIRVAADWDSCAAILCLTHNDQRFQRKQGFEVPAIDQPILCSEFRLTGKWLELHQIMDVWGSPGVLACGVLRSPGAEVSLEGVHFVARAALDTLEPYYN